MDSICPNYNGVGALLTVNGALKRERVAYAFPELRCTFGDRSIVLDIAVLRWEHIPLDDDGDVANVVERAPDWAIEILSPEQNPTKVVKNLLHCLGHGAELDWLIDPAEQTVFVYFPDQRVLLFDAPEEVLPVPGFAQALELSVGELFGWLRVFAIDT